MSILITGITGQDGRILSELIPKIYPERNIVGLSRHSRNYRSKQSCNVIKTHYSKNEIIQTLKQYDVKVVLHLAGMSSVSRSFLEPELARQSIFELTKIIAEACVSVDREIRLVAFNSSEIFGDCPELGAKLETSMAPKSPYGYYKAKTREYLYKLGNEGILDTGNLILFNHESKYRGDNFVIKKILNAALAIKKTGPIMIEMGDLNLQRDWGDANKYMRAGLDFAFERNKREQILCSGHHCSIGEIARLIFDGVGLNFNEFYRKSDDLIREKDIRFSYGSPDNIANLNPDVSITPVELSIQLSTQLGLLKT